MTYDDIIIHFGTPKRAAEKLGVTRPCLSQWKDRGINLGRQQFIQLLTRGKLRANPRHVKPATRAGQ